MSGEDLQRQTSVNIQEKANLIWSIADKLVGLYQDERGSRCQGNHRKERFP